MSILNIFGKDAIQEAEPEKPTAKKYSPAPDVIAVILAIGCWYWYWYSLNYSACPHPHINIPSEPFAIAGEVTRSILEIVILVFLLRGAIRSGQYLFGASRGQEPDTTLVEKHQNHLFICVVLLAFIGYLVWPLVRDDGSEVLCNPEGFQRFLEEGNLVGLLTEEDVQSINDLENYQNLVRDIAERRPKPTKLQQFGQRILPFGQAIVDRLTGTSRLESEIWQQAENSAQME